MAIRCNSCGCDNNDTANFCSRCGSKLIVEDASYREIASDINNNLPAKPNFFISIWRKLDYFCRISLIVFCLLLITGLIAHFFHKVWPIVFTVVQIVLLLLSVLIHFNLIKLAKKWIHYIILVGVICLFYLNFKSFLWSKNYDYAKENAIEVQQKEDSNNSKPVKDVPKDISQDVPKEEKKIKMPFPYDSKSVGGLDFNGVCENLVRQGFVNITSYKCEELDISERSKCGSVKYIKVGGNTEFERNTEFNKQVEIKVYYFDLAPVAIPFSSDEAKTMTADEINSQLMDLGFSSISMDEVYDLDPDEEDALFETELTIGNADKIDKNDLFRQDSKVVITVHYPYKKYTVNLKIDFLSNFFFDKYGLDLVIDYSDLATLSHGEDDNYQLRLTEGKHTLKINKHEQRKPSKEINFEVKNDMDITYQIQCYEDSIHVEETEHIEYGTLEENEVYFPASPSEYRHKNYKNVATALENVGFNNISYKILYDIYFGITSEGEVESVAVNGNTNYRKGDVFTKDVPIVITYHMREEADPNKPTPSPTPKSTKKPASTPKPDTDGKVSYSTNTKDTVKNGNSGVYSYKKSGKLYDIYYIIDFDEGYVYWFTQGDDGNTGCDRVKMESGDLNSVLIITYHDGNDEWSYGLHFKYKNQPTTLIVEDNDHFESVFEPTNLSNALAIRDKRTIYNY